MLTPTITVGLCIFIKGNYDQAVSDYTKAIELNPDCVLFYEGRALAYYEKKEYDKAWDDVHKVEVLGGSVVVEVLDALKKASGREK